MSTHQNDMQWQVLRISDDEQLEKVFSFIQHSAETQAMNHLMQNNLARFRADFAAGRCNGFIAVDQSENVIASCLYSVYYEMWYGRVVYLDSLFVEPRCRNLGVAQGLFKEMLMAGVEGNISKVQFDVFDHNRASVELLTRHAFAKRVDEACPGLHMYHIFRPELERLLEHME